MDISAIVIPVGIATGMAEVWIPVGTATGMTEIGIVGTSKPTFLYFVKGNQRPRIRIGSSNRPTH